MTYLTIYEAPVTPYYTSETNFEQIELPLDVDAYFDSYVESHPEQTLIGAKKAQEEPLTISSKGLDQPARALVLELVSSLTKSSSNPKHYYLEQPHCYPHNKVMKLFCTLPKTPGKIKITWSIKAQSTELIIDFRLGGLSFKSVEMVVTPF
jgi:hypothetical protein